MLFALGILLVLCLTFGALLGFCDVRLRVDGDPLAEKINALLPQTQCGQCGYPGCKPYAEAIVAGSDINRCPPGGQDTINALASLLNVEPQPLDTVCGDEKDPEVALIREDECIGCTKCIQACPVDAIIGAPRFMHTVINDQCTGCSLCIEPCPVDCIDMIRVPTTSKDWCWPKPKETWKAVNTGRR